MLPLARVEAGVGRRDRPRGQAEQAVEARHRVEPPVEAEDVLVQVGLQMMLAGAVVRAEQPGLQVREDQVHHRQMRVLQRVVRARREAVVVEAGCPEPVVALPAVRTNDSAQGHVVAYESLARTRLAVLHDLEA